MPRKSAFKCYFGCTPYKGRVHRFPPQEYPNTEKFDQWIKVLGERDRERGDNYIKNNIRICDNHFEEFYRTGSGRLTKNAVPTLNIGVTIHSFPNPRIFYERFQIWVSLAGASVSGLTDMQIYANRKVCDKHFAEKDKNRNSRLNAQAIPHLHIPTQVMHSFPNPKRHPERFKAWVDLVKCDWEALAVDDIYKKKRICDIHFRDEHRNRFKRLNALAMPTLFLPDRKNEKNTLSNVPACKQSAPPSVPVGDESPRAALCDAMLSSEDDDVPEPSPPPPPLLDLHTAQMCRVCLALDVKMFHLRDTELKIMFHSITGIELEDNEGSTLGSLICWECAARLRAASTFRSKALLSDTLLQRLIKKREQIEKDYFETVKEEADGLVPPKILSATDIIHIVDIKEENNTSQLVQSGDDDQHSILDNSETHKSIMEENFLIVVVGDENVAITTEVEYHSTCLETGDESITKVIDENPKILPEIHQTAVQSDLTSSQEDSDDQIINSFIESIKKKSKTVPEQNIELKTTIKRRKEAVSNDCANYLEEDTEEGNKKKKLKTYGRSSKKDSSQKLAINTQVI